MVGQVRMGVWAAGWVCILSVAGCSSQEPMPTGKPLYDRLGGKTAISAVVDQFVANVAGDSRINGRFATTDISKLKGHLVDQVCAATGGPGTYKGRDMKTTHAGMKISNVDFEALVAKMTTEQLRGERLLRRVGGVDLHRVPLHEAALQGEVPCRFHAHLEAFNQPVAPGPDG